MREEEWEKERVKEENLTEFSREVDPGEVKTGPGKEGKKGVSEGKKKGGEGETPNQVHNKVNLYSKLTNPQSLHTQVVTPTPKHSQQRGEWRGVTPKQGAIQLNKHSPGRRVSKTKGKIKSFVNVFHSLILSICNKNLGLSKIQKPQITWKPSRSPQTLIYKFTNTHTPARRKRKRIKRERRKRGTRGSKASKRTSKRRRGRRRGEGGGGGGKGGFGGNSWERGRGGERLVGKERKRRGGGKSDT